MFIKTGDISSPKTKDVALYPFRLLVDGQVLTVYALVFSYSIGTSAGSVFSKRGSNPKRFEIVWAQVFLFLVRKVAQSSPCVLYISNDSRRHVLHKHLGMVISY